MEVTEEMIKAVREYDRAESRRKAQEAEQERRRKYQERKAAIRKEAMDEVRRHLPELTDEQFDDLADTFDTYCEANRENW